MSVQIERVTLRELILPFLYLAGSIVCFGMVYSAEKIVRALFGTVTGAVGWIPYLGRVVKAPIQTIEKKLVSALGDVEHQLEAQVGAYWHALAKTVTGLGDGLWEIAKTLFAMSGAFLVYDSIRAVYDAIHSLQHAVRALKATATHTVKIVTRTIPAKAGTIAHTLSAAVGALAGEIGHVIDWDLPRLRARDKALSDDLAKLRDWAHGHAKAIGTAVGVGAVTVALSAIGAGWLKCRNWNRYGRGICRTDAALLDAMLLDTLAIFSVVSVVEFAAVLRSVEDEAVAVMRTLVREWPK